MDRATTFVFAVACGLLAADLYYAQPLISLIGKDLGIASATLGFIVTLTQLGYCAGLVLLLPLADRLENRRFVVTLVLGAALAMALAAFAQSAPLFLAATLAAGICSVGAQILVPLSATLAAPGTQGRVIGTIMAGLLGGIMLARPASSAIAQLAGWRAAFLVPAICLVALALLLGRVLPRHANANPPAFREILRSMGEIARHEPILMRRAFYQSCLFASFNIFWTASPIVLEDRFGMDHGGIALFALAGAGGALAAPFAGKLADRGLTRAGSAMAMITLALSFALTIPAVAITSVALLTLMAIVLDAATQTNQVLGQNIAYSLRPQARGRINSIYMSLMFIGGAAGSGLAPFLLVTGGWTLCALVGTGFGLLALAAFATEPQRLPPAA